MEAEVGIVAKGNLDHAREIRGVLVGAGLGAEIIRPPENSGSS